MEKIIAVVVTYNRLECLKKVLSALKEQTVTLDKIIVVNNGSTDGTGEFLRNTNDVIVITQENIGGSGGFWRGMSEALKYESDWIWCMDDDVYPRKDCLEKLLMVNVNNVGILCPRRIQNNQVFYSEYKMLNLSNPFRPLHLKPLRNEDVKSDIPISIEGMVFEGPLIRTEVAKQIGLPHKDLFIFYDDTDYSYRCVLAGYKVFYVPQAIMDKEYFYHDLTSVEIVRSKRWKTWYHIRNTTYFCKKYAKNVFFRTFGEINLPIHMFFAILFNLARNNKYDFNDLRMVIHSYMDGRKGRLGKM